MKNKDGEVNEHEISHPVFPHPEAVLVRALPKRDYFGIVIATRIDRLYEKL
jgi:hypothetical protein